MHPGFIQVVTLRERWMLDFMNQVTDEADWTKRVNDEKVIAKWKEEVTGRAWDHDWTHAGNYRAKIMGSDKSDEQRETSDDFTEEMFQFCIEELQDKAKTYDELSVIPIFDAYSCILKSDKAFPNELGKRFKKAVARLEDIPKEQQDWYPDSGERLLYLVDPSLFPLASGHTWYFDLDTLCLDECLQVAERGEGPFSELAGQNQWLPCDVTFPGGDNAKITTYINNLHPRDHADLYLSLEEVLDIILPFWNLMIESEELYGPLEVLHRIPLNFLDFTKRPVSDTNEEDHPHWCMEDEANQVARSNEHEDELRHESGDGGNEGQRDLYRGFPEKFSPRFNNDAYRDKFAFLDHTEKKIQVVFKLVNVVLTLEKPEHAEEEHWQIEGLHHERIISTAIYYYDDSNIDDSYLTFKRKFLPETPSDIDFDGLKKVFGIEPNDTYTNELGRVKTQSDRLIVFPDRVAYRASSCRLRDPSKPGHRKMLFMMLVDPVNPILSTANVPPQRRDWWLREIDLLNTRLANLPRELLDMIVDRTDDFPMGMKESRYIREELARERRAQTEIRLYKCLQRLYGDSSSHR